MRRPEHSLACLDWEKTCHTPVCQIGLIPGPVQVASGTSQSARAMNWLARPPERPHPISRIPEFQECEAHNEFITSLLINTLPSE
jgi:hypothetical protein